MSLIETRPGVFIDVLNLQPDDFTIEDIATGLAAQFRFSGFTSRPYTVAEHSVYAARIAKREGCTKKVQLQALLHDADEALGLPDIAHPLKVLPEFDGYRDAQARQWKAICDKFEIPTIHFDAVKMIDKRLATTEKLYLKGPDMPPHWQEYAAKWPAYTGVDDIIDRYEVRPQQARRRFLDKFHELVA